VRIVFHDQQVRIGPKIQEEYEATRVQILSPEALTVGNVTLTWAPANEEMTIHRLAILRDGRVIDVLKTQKFSILQRESNLEQSTLSGDLTANLQTVGLQVGDELELRVTKTRRQTALGEKPQGFLQFPVVGVRGAYRRRILDQGGESIAYRASPDVPAAIVSAAGRGSDRQFLLTDPASATLPDGAPPRYAITRLVQFSGYRDWAAVSQTFDPVFASASTLAASSPVKAEAARIAAQTADPARRAEAALRLVQDRIRYVYVGLDGGNYRPAAADETWSRRFGDCKGKTVLLIALLRELGITAEPVLVSSTGADGSNERLPTPALFDHVVARAIIDGQSVWLDGTRSGDRALKTLAPPPSRWALPLRASGATLERVAAPPPRVPSTINAVEIDASAGFDKPAKFRYQKTIRSDDIIGMRAQLAGLAAADADKLMAAYWRQETPWIEPAKTSWRFDEANRFMVLGMEGEGKLDWNGGADEGHTYYLYAGGFSPPAEFKRPKDQPQDASWAKDYPSFTCDATTIKVPAATKGFRWVYSSKPMSRTLAGTHYWRISAFDGTTARMVRSKRVMVPEISAKEAADANAALPSFDNYKSYVWEMPIEDGLAVRTNSTAKFGTFEDFASAAPPCQD
jgi:hypothetical protein